MALTENSYAHTEKLLANALALVTQLHELMILEADALLQRSTAETISDIAANKQSLTSTLEQFNSQLDQILASENLPSTDEGVLEYFQKAQEAGLSIQRPSDDWSQIKLLSAECRQHNEQNGMSINLLALHNQRSLQILKGQTQSNSTYSRNGSSQKGTLSNNMLSA